MLSQQPRYQQPSSRHLISCLSRQQSLGLRLEPQDRGYSGLFKPNNTYIYMGSYDGAEVCELVGLYILSLLGKMIDQKNVGLYRDDSLILLKNQTEQQTDRIRKNIITIFKEIVFKIEITTNLNEVDFLDVTFNLENNTYCPYKKPNDKLIYIHTKSNHPPQIIKQLPYSISERLSKNSSTSEIFNNTKGDYEDALKKMRIQVNYKLYSNNQRFQKQAAKKTENHLVQPTV